MVGVGRDLKGHLTPSPPATGRDPFHQPRVLKAQSNLALGTARAPGQAGLGLTTLTGKKLVLISTESLPSFRLKPLMIKFIIKIWNITFKNQKFWLTGSENVAIICVTSRQIKKFHRLHVFQARILNENHTVFYHRWTLSCVLEGFSWEIFADIREGFSEDFQHSYEDSKVQQCFSKVSL